MCCLSTDGHESGCVKRREEDEKIERESGESANASGFVCASSSESDNGVEKTEGEQER
jgi:hypothetical protein